MWVLSGTVTNNSKFDLGSMKFLVTIRDCPINKTDCIIIGEDSATVYVGVPAGQARLFKSYWSPSGAFPRFCISQHAAR